MRVLAARRAVPLLALLVLTGCGGGYTWGWHVITPFTDGGTTNLRFLIGGLGFTILLSVIAIFFSVVIGLLVALPALSKNPMARMANRFYVEITRAIPILVLLLWVFYGLPVVIGISISVFWAGVISLALADSGFQAEIFRAGIQSIDKGQHEASQSLGLRYFDKMRYVILPQAIRRILPPLGNQFVFVLKMSSLVSVIGLGELTRRANELVVTQYRPLEIYTFLVFEYLALILVVSYLVRWMERRMGSDETEQVQAKVGRPGFFGRLAGRGAAPAG